VQDLGPRQTQFGLKEKIRLVWVIEERDSTGRYKLVMETFTKSLHEKSGLYAALKGYGFIKPDTTRIDLEGLVGRQARFTVEHNKATNGKVYANVASRLKADKGQNVEIPSDYKPPKVKVEEAKAATAGTSPINDEDIPF
jgi:hypothetical protein